MKYILHKSGGLSATAFGLLLISLWALLALSSPSRQNAQALPEAPASYSLALPTLMAPVIRKEVRKDSPGEVAYSRDCIKLPVIPRTLISLP